MEYSKIRISLFGNLRMIKFEYSNGYNANMFVQEAHQWDM